MTTRYNLTSPRKNGDKTFWMKIGSAFPSRNGEGFQLVFDALPLPDADGRVMVLMSPPREDGQSSQARAADRAQRPTGGAPAGGSYDDMSDTIPFAASVL